MKARPLQVLAAVAVVVLVACVLFWPLVRGALGGEKRFLEWDVPEQYWPDLVYLCDALHDGELPSWNPYDRAGYPWYADPQTGAYHPLNWGICLLAGSAPALGWAEARVVLGFVLAGLFGLLWLRRLKLPWGPAVLGAVVIQTAPFMRHNWELNLTLAFAWLPLMLWAAERAVCERRYADGAVLGLAVALCAWTGSPPAFWLAALFCGCYTLVRLVGTCRGQDAWTWLAAVRSLFAAAVFSLGLVAAVVWPGLQLASRSVQAGRSFSDIAAGSLAPGQLSALLWPQVGNHLYPGLFVLLLSMLCLLRPLRRKAVQMLPGRWFFLVAAVLAVLLALGDHTPVFGLAYDLVAGFSLFRLPHRYEAWLGPALGALAAGGLAWLGTPVVAARLRGWRPTKYVAAAAAGLGVILAAAGVGWGPAGVCLAAGVAGGAILLPRLGVHHGLVGALLAVVLLCDVSQTLPPERHTAPGASPAGETSGVLQRAAGTRHDWRYMDEFVLSCRSGTRLGRRDLRGYQDPLMLKSQERVLAALAGHPRLAEQFNVRYALCGPHFIHGWNRHYLPPPGELLRIPGARDLGRGVIELPGALPAAYWVPLHRLERAPDRSTALKRLAGLAPAPIAILEGTVDGPRDRPDPHGLAVRPERSEPARRFELERDRLSFVIEAPADGMVVVNETWYPGWRATVDGRQVPIHRVNALVRGIYVDAGTHRVRMEFAPFDGAASRWALLATLAAALLTILGGLLFHRGDGDGTQGMS